MRTKVRKWGNSLALRLPGSFVKELRLSDSSDINLTLTENKIVISPVRPQKGYSLKKLLARISKKNLHNEADTGKAVGKEVW